MQNFPFGSGLFLHCSNVPVTCIVVSIAAENVSNSQMSKFWRSEKFCWTARQKGLCNDIQLSDPATTRLQLFTFWNQEETRSRINNIDAAAARHSQPQRRQLLCSTTLYCGRVGDGICLVYSTTHTHTPYMREGESIGFFSLRSLQSLMSSGFFSHSPLLFPHVLTRGFFFIWEVKKKSLTLYLDDSGKRGVCEAATVLPSSVGSRGCKEYSLL